MANKRKGKQARVLNVTIEKPRAPQGMYLRVVVTNNGGMYLPITVGTFRDMTRAGHKVAQAVRDYLRGVELVPHPRPYVLTVSPEWVETAPAPRRNSAAARPGEVRNG